ncbi:hypothetical protein Exig_2671 [Exiguobacterium sibiricum 255-15]|uniref:Uncharacterized protein n=1 Tax=Exiguobacterium sibiricum (strain DSM 17290 / CCUG 55495 / CIP 109462 / JCM 13490 / 255-15) TaxID=262543 RepID=B1YMQ9_EXIS2|nr:hypothetical protein [Exiguobacterium sibiricum]ACB62119.1 hypothetical protein Exig_2671 [Exiguobacterium sibiricum 255-15]
MKRFILSLLCLTMAATLLPVRTEAAVTVTRHTVMWSIPEAKQIPTKVTQLANRQMKRVYLHVAVEGDRTLYRTFVEKAHLAGIEVYFLFGQPSWITNEGTTNRPNVEDPLAWISVYLQETMERPDGISVDLEPYALPAWETDQASVIASYQRLLTAFHDVSTAQNLPLQLFLPFWFHTVPDASGQPLSEWAMELADEVTLMSYRTVYSGGNGLAAITMTDALYAASHQHLLSYALEFTELPETPSITFYGKTRTALNQLVNQTMNSSLPPSAIVYHDFDAYQDFMRSTQ